MPRLEARPGPAGLAAASNRAALGMTRPGPAGLAAASNRAAPGMIRPGPAGLAAASNRAAPGMIRPGHAAAHVHRSQAPWHRDDRLLNNVARNSRASISNTEIASLELQRFEHILKTDRCKLRATFVLADVVASSQR